MKTEYLLGFGMNTDFPQTLPQESMKIQSQTREDSKI